MKLTISSSTNTSIPVALLLVVTSCSLFPSAQAGSCWTEDGVSRSCSAQGNSCYRVSGCYYSYGTYSGSRCTGVAQSCTLYSSKGSCNSDYGCKWDEETGFKLIMVAIFVGIGVAAAAIAFAIRWCVVRRRRRLHPNSNDQNQQPSQNGVRKAGGVTIKAVARPVVAKATKPHHPAALPAKNNNVAVVNMEEGRRDPCRQSMPAATTMTAAVDPTVDETATTSTKEYTTEGDMQKITETETTTHSDGHQTVIITETFAPMDPNRTLLTTEEEVVEVSDDGNDDDEEFNRVYNDEYNIASAAPDYTMVSL